MPPSKAPPHDPQQDSKPKKRHRHSSYQLAALNELYDQDEHPALHLRTALATRIGMETKTVNAWFQNKRASSRKRSRATSSYDPPFTSTVKSSSSTHSRQRSAAQDQSDDEHYMSEAQASRPITNTANQAPNYYMESSTFVSASPEDDMSAMSTRNRPSPEKVEELRAYFNLNPHPTKDEREVLGDRLGMHYQAITSWFQNQRSLIKERGDDDVDSYGYPYSTSNELPLDPRLLSPAPGTLPSFHMQPPTYNASTRHPRSSSATPSTASSPSRRSASQRASTPYGHALLSTMSHRTRRTRPEAFQLDALKELFNKTQHPSIQERTALAQDLGMDVVKVTNWFRNLRQTSRKRAKKGNSDDEDNDNDDYGSYHHDQRFRSLSRSTSSFEADIDRRAHLDMHNNIHRGHSEYDSDDDYFQEAVTPSPEHSPSPSPPSLPTQYRGIGSMPFETAPMSPMDKAAAAKYSNIRYEDAMLLLSFHQHIVH